MATRRSKRVASKRDQDELDKIIAEVEAQGAASRNRERATTRRSDRMPGQKLADGFEEIIAQTQASVYQEMRDAREARYAGITCKFSRLFDLPPELRAIIYIYAMEPEPETFNAIENLFIPGLAMVSKQVRAEALPLFFSDGLFLGIICSNYPEIPFLDQEEWFNPVNLDPAERLELEKVKYAKHLTNGLFRSPGSSRAVFTGLRKREQLIPIFRNVQFVVYSDYFDPSVMVGKCEAITVAITVATSRKMRPRLSLLNPEKAIHFPNELQKVFERVRVKVDAIAEAKQTFLGFTLEEVEAIAMEFGYWPVFD
ncbi:hypothetical protein LTR56_024845 [Elasticomyces elasticus]|nr:hypothetical protein LTR56_024845 [Elasticomyces elasticus]